ncbi:hypothetical protein [Comamonas aquatica]|uniref:hypothetical protein n=1 Tax=Comamonas aquatica TaxID=225991 RepID=UPI0009F71A9E|nr:hypothetical protein [Comamonas aquatica]
MSTLQISLAVVGVILLGLIVAYNTWTHRRNAPKRAQYADGDTRLGEGHSRFDPALDGVDVTDLPPSHRAPVVDPLMDAAPAQEAQAGIWAAGPTCKSCTTSSTAVNCRPAPCWRAACSIEAACTTIWTFLALQRPSSLRLLLLKPLSPRCSSCAPS